MMSVEPAASIHGPPTPKPPKLWKKASLEWLNRPRTLKTKPSQSAMRINLSFANSSKGSTTPESSDYDGSPPLPSPRKMLSPTRISPTRQNSENDGADFVTVKALASREILVRMLDDPKCLWMFGQFLAYEANAEALVFWLNAEQHRQDLERLHSLTRRVHSLHVPTSAALALNISSTERNQLDAASQAFLALEDPFATARNSALEFLIRDAWPRFLHHRLSLRHDMEMRTLGAPKGELDVATCFCLTSASAEDDYPITAISDGFVSITGYTHNEAVGRNCRFLQGTGTDAATVARIRNACRNGDASTELLLNYRRDGSPFQNFLRTIPLRDGSDRLVAFLGYQVNIARRSSLGPLLADELDALDERLPAGGMCPLSSVQKDQQTRCEGAILARLNAQTPAIVGREQRLREAADLAFGATAHRDSKAAARRTSVCLDGSPKVTPRSGAGNAERPSTASDAASQTGSASERERLLKDMSARWLVLDAHGTTVRHVDARLVPHFTPGGDFSAAVKPYSPALPKRVKHLAKAGEAATEKALIVLYSGMPAQEVMLAISPLKGADGRTTCVVVLFGV